MNREIDYITTVTTHALLTASGQWTHSSGTPSADEVCIRQVTYTSADGGTSIYLIRSNLQSNATIATVCSTRGFTSNPGTRIQLFQNPGPLTFQLFIPTATGVIPATPTAGDMISINMDFIKYRENNVLFRYNVISTQEDQQRSRSRSATFEACRQSSG